MLTTIARPIGNPMVTILDVDFDRLEALAAAGEASGHPAAAFLATELERAVVRPAGEIGPGIVRMNSRVSFRIDGRDMHFRTLVYPEEYVRRAGQDDCVSVMTPLGAALLGLRVGAGMDYATAGGTKQHVTVVAVLQADGDDGPASVAGPDGDGAPRRSRGSRRHGNDEPGPTAA